MENTYEGHQKKMSLFSPEDDQIAITLCSPWSWEQPTCDLSYVTFRATFAFRVLTHMAVEQSTPTHDHLWLTVIPVESWINENWFTEF